MSTAFTNQYPDLYDTRALNIIATHMLLDDTYFDKLLAVVQRTGRHNDTIRMSGLGAFGVKDEGSPISYDSPVQGARRRSVYQSYALGFRATREAMMDARYRELEKMPEDLARSAKEHKENLAVGLFDDAFDGNVHTGLDGLPWCSASHTVLKPNVAGTTQSNLISPGIQLSVEGLEAMWTNFRLRKSEEDRFVGASGKFQPRWLVIHPQNRHVADTILSTEKRPGGDLNDINTVASSRSGVAAFDWPHLADEESYWLMASPNEDFLVWNDRESASADRSIDSTTKDRLFDLIYRASVEVLEWRYGTGSQV